MELKEFIENYIDDFEDIVDDLTDTLKNGYYDVGNKFEGVRLEERIKVYKELKKSFKIHLEELC